jgi:hypothetical protein
VFSGQVKLSCVPQEVGEIIVQFRVVRKRLQSGSGKQKLRLDLRPPLSVCGEATPTDIPYMTPQANILQETSP